MVRSTRKPRMTAALAIAALTATGCSVFTGTKAADPTVSSAVAHTPSNPVARPSSTSAPTSGLRSPFVSLGGYLARRSGVVTAAVYDARSGRTWVLNPGVREYTASIVKVQIMATALREAQSSGHALSASASALIQAMIENSDNQSATTLLAQVGGPSAVLRFDRSAGLNETIPSTLALIPGTQWPGWGLTKTTALDEVSLISMFAYPSLILSDADRRYGLDLMERVQADQAWGVSAGITSGTTVALKNGWLPLAGSGWQVNSIGWISGNGRNYVLAVLTSASPTEAYGIATVATIARTVFAELGPKSPLS